MIYPFFSECEICLLLDLYGISNYFHEILRKIFLWINIGINSTRKIINKWLCQSMIFIQVDRWWSTRSFIEYIFLSTITIRQNGNIVDVAQNNGSDLVELNLFYLLSVIWNKPIESSGAFRVVSWVGRLFRGIHFINIHITLRYVNGQTPCDESYIWSCIPFG